MTLGAQSTRGRTRFSVSLVAVVALVWGCGGRATSQDDTGASSGGHANSGGSQSHETTVGGATSTASPITSGKGGQTTAATADPYGGIGGQSTSATLNAYGGAVLDPDSGTGGATISSTLSASGGKATKVSCQAVTCPALPNACTKLVQPPGECCATCLESACEPCVAMDCAPGTHSETVPGDCCPSCVANPPSQCDEDRSSYASSRETLISKYGSHGCTTSPDCVIVPEKNACAWTCGIPIPAVSVSNLKSNLTETSRCSSCPAPEEVLCEQMVPACVNGKCVAADPG